MIAFPSRPSSIHLLACIGLAIGASLLLFNVVSLIRGASLILPYPYQFDYGEGIVWQQMRDMLQGRGYRPLGVLPAIVYHYPPVFHGATALLAHGAGLDELLAGRLVSLLSSLACACLVGWLSAGLLPCASRFERFGCALFAGTACFLWSPVMTWAPLMRVDMLACALSLGGLALAIQSVGRPRLIHLASLAFVLAVFTKQVSVAAPAAAFVALTRVHPALAWRLAGGCLLLGSLTLAVLSYLTAGEFVRHIVIYNVNRIDLGRAAALIELVLAHAAAMATCAFGVWAVVRPALRAWTRADRSPASLGALTVLLYLAIKTAMLPMVMKSGAASNYFVEWCLALTIFLGPAVAPVLAFVSKGAGIRRLPSPLLVVSVVVCLPAAALGSSRWSVARETLVQNARQLQPIVAAVRAAEKPVVSDEMTLLIRAGREVVWEPAIAAELGHSGVYDERAFAALVQAGAFAFFLTEGQRRDGIFGERYNPVVADAVDKAYPTKQAVGSFTLHLPRP